MPNEFISRRELPFYNFFVSLDDVGGWYKTADSGIEIQTDSSRIGFQSSGYTYRDVFGGVNFPGPLNVGNPFGSHKNRFHCRINIC